MVVGQIISIDPGLTTGYCKIDVANRLVRGTQLSPEMVASALQFDLSFGLLYNDPEYYSLVIVEDFVGAGRRDPSIVGTIQLLGFVRYYCHLRGVQVIVQAPQYRKAFVPTAKQRYPEYAWRHRMDAWAHALAYFTITEEGGALFNAEDRGNADRINAEFTSQI